MFIKMHGTNLLGVNMIAIILTVAIAGFVVWIVTQITMPVLFKNIIYGVVAICLIIWVLQVLGFNTGVPSMRL